MEIHVTRTGAIERDIQRLEGIIVIIRRHKNELLPIYNFQRASRGDISVMEFLQNRLGPMGITPDEVVVVDGNHQFTWGDMTDKITMAQLRDTFKEKVAD